MNHLVIAVKTTEGGLWILPQVLEARDRGIRVTVITPDGEGRLVDALRTLCDRDPEVRHQRSPFDFSFRPSWHALVGLWRLRRLLADLRPTWVLYHLYATALALRLSTLGLSVRKVHMIAGPLYLESRLIRATERILARRDDLIVCGSSYTRHRYARLGLRSDRLTVIPYGVDTRRFQPQTAEDRQVARSSLGLRGDTFVVAMVAFVYAPKRLVYKNEGIKGHRFLLEAWQRFHLRHPDAELVLIGSGFDARGEQYRQRLIESYDGGQMGLAAANVHWLSSVDDVRRAYRAADLSVSPSLSDNHGAVLEASSMGVPSIVSNAGALPEGVTEESGWVVSAGSSTELLDSLEKAYGEWQQGSLAARGESARSFIARCFDSTDLTKRLFDRVHG